jgi:hypothetical protein
MISALVPPSPGFHVSLGELPTWLGVLAASVAALFVYLQLRAQQQQLGLQQQELTRQVAAIERQQANDVDVVHGQVVNLTDTGPGTAEHIDYWSVQITNSSRRPIREVAARIEPQPGTPLVAPWQLRLASTDQPAGGYVPGTGVPVLRKSVTVGFVFIKPFRQHPQARILVRFTDDAGLHWQIDENLHLSRLGDERDW